uniref:Proteasome subunit alpha type-5 n=1 Tax=Macrostomum lignano TaxID=282301 RepID=A0A1I8IC18_9PLAT
QFIGIMFLTRTEYDRGVNTFSPEGRLFQVEYAIEATKLGSTGIGIQTSEGVVLAVEKRVTSNLLVPSSIEKIFEVDKHIGCAVSGLVADARTLIERARVEATHHWFVHGEQIHVEDVTRSQHGPGVRDDASKGAMSRPFGVALLFAGVDPTGPRLFHMDPSGTYINYQQFIGIMFLTRTEYDRGVNTFSPEGRLFQVEYAIEATKLGSTGIGIQTSEGVVLAVEKRVTSNLLVPSSIEKIFEVDKHIGCAVSGLVADARTLIERARVEATHHWFVHGEQIHVEDVTRSVSNMALAFGDDASKGAMSRPFGVALLFAGVDPTGPRLFHMDPSGTYINYQYDRGVNTFSPEGRLFQVEYAIEATKLGSTGIGIQTSEGVVLAVEKRVTSNLLVPSSIEKIFEVDKHIGCAVSGLVADARTLIERARVEATHHWFVHGEQIHVEDVTRSVSNMALAFGDDASKGAMSRPFGVALLFAGVDPTGPQAAKAIGSGHEGAQQQLEEAYHSGMSLRDALVLALKILKQVMEEKLDMTNVEVVTVTPDRKYHLLAKEEVEAVIAEVGSSSGP